MRSVRNDVKSSAWTRASHEVDDLILYYPRVTAALALSGGGAGVMLVHIMDQLRKITRRRR